jgi:hypothetical protein
MAKEIAQLTSERLAEPGPRNGWVDRLIRRVDGLPGPAWISYVVLLLGAIVLAHVLEWASGDRAPGTIDSDLFAVLLAAYCLGLISFLDGVSRSAFSEFRPALGGVSADHEDLAADLTSIPDRQAVVAVLLAEIVLTLGYFSDGQQFERVAHLPPVVLVLQLAAYWTVIAAVALLILHTIRQLRLVSRLQALATSIDLLNPAPLNTFSRLTAATAIGLMAVELPFALDSTSPNSAPAGFFIAQMIGLLILASAAFVLPLRGLHRRLSLEKGHLLTEANERLKATLGRVHATVDANDMERADQLQKTLSSLIAEREILSKLSTWPWSTGTFRGVASAVLLPIFIWLLNRVLETSHLTI